MKRIVAALAFGLLAASAAKAATQEQLDFGKARFKYWCAPCHAAETQEGRLLPGTYSLQLKYKGAKPAALEQRTDLLPAFTKLVIRRGIGGMPFFRKTELSDPDVDDIAAYLAQNGK